MSAASMPMGGIEIRVEEADALTRSCDVLVLKYAQSLYGVDAKAVRATGTNEGSLPGSGGHLVVEGRPRIGAGQLVFLGTPGLSSFSYDTIRQFGRRAIAAAARVTPEAREICLTLHGAGFGLDETEAFEAELGGVVEAISEETYPAHLEAITFLELNGHIAARMRATLARLYPKGRIEAARPYAAEAIDSQAADHLRSVGYDSAAKGHAFVAMPFSDHFEDAFHFGIAPAIRDAGMLCERMDKVSFTGDIGLHMKSRIGTAKFVVADLTGANPNVYLEVGYAWGCGVPTILICEDAGELAFDVRSQRCLLYKSIRELERKLTQEIGELLAARG